MNKFGVLTGVLLLIALIFLLIFQFNLFSTSKNILDEEIEGSFTIEEISLENFPSRNTTRVSLAAKIENQEIIESLSESLSDTKVTLSDERHSPLRYMFFISTNQGETYLLHVDHQYISFEDQLYKVKGENKLYTALEQERRIDWEVWVGHTPLSDIK
ncbi:hypothetical protein [Alkalibacillus haloalkaliphilus]|uniref:hypothetical protein n=1 Tax=Alkalibacillus haloalkaliphilus TaxID=94136 RepID=UPI0029367606|nr:hypothetical protein [Alkalibacillus haloalkaliphilus]MDV2583471.1 hypothetical protein [Alkalibacillus haloalkaliphilus]